jgi:hypothetical protein
MFYALANPQLCPLPADFSGLSRLCCRLRPVPRALLGTTDHEQQTQPQLPAAIWKFGLVFACCF